MRSLLEKSIITVEDGWAVKTTEKLTVFGGFSVKLPLIGPIIKSPESLSRVTTVIV